MKLLEQTKIGNQRLKNCMVMAPMTKIHANLQADWTR
jgi:2,4-dienoyl-CoA reductase-like NADH-dependent reductase (Old Yellow Enzyme family)